MPLSLKMSLQSANRLLSILFRNNSKACSCLPACLADMVFVVDDSGSIKDGSVQGQSDSWDTVKTFISRLVDIIDFGWVKTRVAVVTFSNAGIVQFDLDDYWERPRIKEAIQRLPYTGGNTNTTGGLRVARQKVLTSQRGDRPDVRNVVVLVTDGKATREMNGLADEADRIKAAGTMLIGIGVTSNVDENMMTKLVTSRPSEHYFYVKQFKDLSSIVQRVATVGCRSVQVATPVPTGKVNKLSPST